MSDKFLLLSVCVNTITVLYHTSGERLKHTMNTHRVKPFIMAAVKDNITGHRSDWSLLGTWEAIARAKV